MPIQISEPSQPKPPSPLSEVEILETPTTLPLSSLALPSQPTAKFASLPPS